MLRDAAGTPVPAAATCSAATETATPDPASALAADTFTVTVVGGTTALRDAADTPPAGTSRAFITGPAPAVTAFTPGGGALLVPRNNNVAVTFGGAVQGTDPSTFTVLAGPARKAGPTAQIGPGRQVPAFGAGGRRSGLGW